MTIRKHLTAIIFSLGFAVAAAAAVGHVSPSVQAEDPFIMIGACDGLTIGDSERPLLEAVGETISCAAGELWYGYDLRLQGIYLDVDSGSIEVVTYVPAETFERAVELSDIIEAPQILDVQNHDFMDL